MQTHTDCKWWDAKRYSMQMETNKKAKIAVSILDKIDFKMKRVIRDREGHPI